MHRFALAALVVLVHLGCDGSPPQSPPAAPPATAAGRAPAGARAPAALGLENFDALRASGLVQAFAPELATSPLVGTAYDLHLDPALGQPSFLWAAGRTAAAPSLKD